MSRPHDKAPGRSRCLPAISFGATGSTTTSARSSPVPVDEEIVFLGSRTIDHATVMVDTDGIDRMVARLEALGTKVLTLESNNAALSCRITALESDQAMLLSKNAALEAEVVVLKDVVGSLTSQLQTDLQLSTSTCLGASSIGSPIEGFINAHEDKEIKGKELQTALGGDMAMQLSNPLPGSTDNSNDSSMYLTSTDIEHSDRASAAAAVEPASRYILSNDTRADFPYFGKLPLEIRSMIWKLATLEPRVYTIRKAKNVYGLGHASALVPTLLHVCRESRCVTKDLYSRTEFGFGAYTYFNKNDFIYLGCEKAPACLSANFCYSTNCSRSFGAIGAPKTISRYIYEVVPGTRPFYDISITFDGQSNLEEILLISSDSDCPPKESVLSDFKEITTPFEWQHGRSLLQCWRDELMMCPGPSILDSLRRITRVEYVKG